MSSNRVPFEKGIAETGLVRKAREIGGGARAV
jgi:hypothetical protein